jgi:hypothetical protein
VIRAIRQWLKWKIARDEMFALHRYRTASQEACKWLGQIPNAESVALWIRCEGEGVPVDGIHRFRCALEDGKQLPLELYDDLPSLQ